MYVYTSYILLYSYAVYVIISLYKVFLKDKIPELNLGRAVCIKKVYVGSQRRVLTYRAQGI